MNDYSKVHYPFICAISSSIQKPSAPPEEERDMEPDDEGSQEEERKQSLAVIPYVSCVSERIRKACEKFDLRVVFKSGPTLHSLLTKWKTPFPRRSWQVWSTRSPASAVKYMSEKRRGIYGRESKNTWMHATRGTCGSLPLLSISGTSNIKWIVTKLRCWTEPPDLSSWR